MPPKECPEEVKEGGTEWGLRGDVIDPDNRKQFAHEFGIDEKNVRAIVNQCYNMIPALERVQLHGDDGLAQFYQGVNMIVENASSSTFMRNFYRASLRSHLVTASRDTIYHLRAESAERVIIADCESMEATSAARIVAQMFVSNNVFVYNMADSSSWKHPDKKDKNQDAQAIENCKAVILILTPHVLTKGRTWAALLQACAKGKVIIGVMIGDFAGARSSSGQSHYRIDAVCSGEELAIAEELCAKDPDRREGFPMTWDSIKKVHAHMKAAMHCTYFLLHLSLDDQFREMDMKINQVIQKSTKQLPRDVADLADIECYVASYGWISQETAFKSELAPDEQIRARRLITC
jgi:hypothetical protein